MIVAKQYSHHSSLHTGTDPTDSKKLPAVWLLMGHKTGDNSQTLALAEALKWPYVAKHLVYRKSELLTNILLGPTLAGIYQDQSTPLISPWPDLIITAGRRNEPVARWIKKHSGAHSRIVHIGRPWARLNNFDLVITTPQYQLPQAPNILHNSLPLHRITELRLNEAANTWRPKLAHLPRPYTTVLIGGNSGPFTLNPLKMEILAQRIDKMAQATGGSLLITTSARTPDSSIEILKTTIQSPAYLHLWPSQATENPYFAFLALASDIVVTGDSISMLTEACMTRKPLYIFDLSDGTQANRPATTTPSRPWWHYAYNYRFRPLSHRLAMWLGPRRMRRDVSIMHHHLIDSRRAAWLGQNVSERSIFPPLTDLEHAVKRVNSLF